MLQLLCPREHAPCRACFAAHPAGAGGLHHPDSCHTRPTAGSILAGMHCLTIWRVLQASCIHDMSISTVDTCPPPPPAWRAVLLWMQLFAADRSFMHIPIALGSAGLLVGLLGIAAALSTGPALPAAHAVVSVTCAALTGSFATQTFLDVSFRCGVRG